MRYMACALQPTIQPVYDGAGPLSGAAMARNLEHVSHLIRQAHRETGAQLFVLPEFCLQGYTRDRSVQDWIAASVCLPGPESARLAELARELGVFVCAAVYEVMPEFPGRYWNTAFVIDDTGELILRYRKLYAMTSKTRPGDVLREWCERFGAESLFPVVETRIGRLAALVARDTHWPEVPRSFALRGAEILLNPLGAGRSPLERDSIADCVRRVRAYENSVYMVTANIGPFVETQVADALERVPSEIIDFRGTRVAVAPGGLDGWAVAQIDLAALRRHRVTPGRNPLAQLQPELHARGYAQARLFPTDAWSVEPIRSEAENADVERATIGRMLGDGLLVAPGPGDSP